MLGEFWFLDRIACPDVSCGVVCGFSTVMVHNALCWLVKDVLTCLPVNGACHAMRMGSPTLAYSVLHAWLRKAY